MYFKKDVMNKNLTYVLLSGTPSVMEIEAQCHPSVNFATCYVFPFHCLYFLKGRKQTPHRATQVLHFNFLSPENADDVAEHILNLINDSAPLDEEETKIIVSKISDISQCDEISMNLTQVILQIISAVLGKQSNSSFELHEVSNE